MRFTKHSSKLIFLVSSLVAAPLAADDVADIGNYIEYSPLFSSSAQPTAAQLGSASQAGFKRVIYLAFSDDHTAIETEDRVVKNLAMDYIHIPVDFANPTIEDFEDFAAVMNRNKTRRTLVHCQINLRASTFSFLYRVIYGGIPLAQAKQNLDSIWVPDKVWFKFIVRVMKQHGRSHECAECDWGENEFAA